VLHTPPCTQNSIPTLTGSQAKPREMDIKAKPLLEYRSQFSVFNPKIVAGQLQRNLQARYNIGRKTAIKAALNQQCQLSRILTLQGYCSNRWGSAIPEKSEDNNGYGKQQMYRHSNHANLDLGHYSMGGWKQMFSTTSNEKNQRIVLSAMDERIKVLNNKKNEICIMDNHLFKRLLTKVLV